MINRTPIFLAAMLAIAACSSSTGTQSSNLLNLGEKSVALDQVLVEHYDFMNRVGGLPVDTINLGYLLAPDSIDLIGESGTGMVLALDVFADRQQPPNGEFQISDIERPGFFGAELIYVDADEEPELEMVASAGRLSIEHHGLSVRLSGDLELPDGQMATFHYVGPLTIADGDWPWQE